MFNNPIPGGTGSCEHGPPRDPASPCRCDPGTRTVLSTVRRTSWAIGINVHVSRNGAGALFIPSLALALGVWTGTSRFFEGLYTAIWYIGPLNRVPGLDFTGGGSGPLAGRFAWLYLAVSATLLAAALARRARQLRGI